MSDFFCPPYVMSKEFAKVGNKMNDVIQKPQQLFNKASVNLVYFRYGPLQSIICSDNKKSLRIAFILRATR